MVYNVQFISLLIIPKTGPKFVEFGADMYNNKEHTVLLGIMNVSIVQKDYDDIPVVLEDHDKIKLLFSNGNPMTFDLHVTSK